MADEDEGKLPPVDHDPLNEGAVLFFKSAGVGNDPELNWLKQVASIQLHITQEDFFQ
jgi:hypothetical protein